MKLTRSELATLLGLVDATAEVEIDCDRFLERVASYLDRLAPDGRPTGFDDVRQHLRVCPECLEEFEALVATHPSADDGEAT